ncbi:hypothetical protein HPB47_022783 [Ixodes persulcatus]|uniref:Uncharacterized protein n=1 Tax=Ixodes persulcatus TaxID=34615 RepID=A0AC60Q8R0_IXOPE|nr:hypothetical protein HPB47_022783 [Ixodes persulcatus]
MKQERAADGFGSCRPPPTTNEPRRSGLAILIQNSPRRIPAYISAAKASQPRKQTKPKLGGAQKKHDSASGRRRPCATRNEASAVPPLARDHINININTTTTNPTSTHRPVEEES